MKMTIKTLFTTLTLSMSALLAGNAMAAPQHEPRPNGQPHWNNQNHQKWNDDRRWNNDNRYKQHQVNPSRDWRVGQTLPRQYDSNRYQLSDREARRLPNTGRYQQWYKVNGDYVLVNERNNKIIRIIN